MNIQQNFSLQFSKLINVIQIMTLILYGEVYEIVLRDFSICNSLTRTMIKSKLV